MKPVVYTSVAIILWGFMNLLIEEKFAKYDTATILVSLYTVMLPLAFVRRNVAKAMGNPVDFPHSDSFWLLGVVAVLYFFGDYFYLSAYGVGGSVMTVTSILIMLPVFASTVKFFWFGGLPNVYQIAGFLLAGAALCLVGKGS